MPWYTRRLVIGSAASVFIAMFGVTLVWNTVRNDPQLADLNTPIEVAPKSGSPPASRADSPGPEAAVRSEETLTRMSDEDLRAALQKLQKEETEAPRATGIAKQEARDEPVAEDRVAQPTLAEGAGLAATTAPAPPAVSEPAKDAEGEEVVVTGLRRAQMQAMEVKRESVVVSERIQPGRGGPKSMVSPRPSRTAGNADKRPGEMVVVPVPPQEFAGRDKFQHFDVNPVKQVADEPVSTFSADVDTASYSFIRKQLDQGVLPQKDAVRAEEMINYFDYSWPAADSREQPFRPTVVVSDSPWGKGRKLIHIGIKGYELPAGQRPDANLVMLLDVSGSMSSPDKLPLVRQSMKLLLGSLKPTDMVSIVVYAGAAGMVLPPTPVGEKEKIVAALDSLSPGGSTAGAEGIELAYQLAEQNFRKEGVNRILLCTDGDFNVGIAGTEELKGFVERKREKGVFLSVLGFGQGNYRDELAQALAQNGNGVAAYIDSLTEAQKVLVQEAGSSLFTIAKDVKLQVEFNPATVAEYRLVGYETRALKREDFNNDAIDAGDIGAGHTVTAIYEITPVGVDTRMVDQSRYAKKRKPDTARGTANEYGYLKIRYKLPKESRSRLIEQAIGLGGSNTGADIQRDAEFSTAVAGFAQLLRGGQFTGSLTYDDVIKAALASRGEDAFGYRNEFVQLVRKAQTARGM